MHQDADELQRRIADGDYRVEPDAVAEALLRRPAARRLVTSGLACEGGYPILTTAATSRRDARSPRRTRPRLRLL